MNEREAQEIIRMVESNWSFDLDTARAMWRQALMPFDPEIATQAVIRLGRTSARRPNLVDMIEVVTMLSPLPEPRRSDSCKTCNGDLFVTVYLRKPVTTEWMAKNGRHANEEEMIEEVAPCPDCNAAANTSFRRHDGSEAQTLDPEKVRELIASVHSSKAPPPSREEVKALIDETTGKFKTFD